MFNERYYGENHIATTSRTAVKLLDKLDEIGLFNRYNDMRWNNNIKEDYSTRSKELECLDIKGCDNSKLKEYFDSFFKTTNRIKSQRQKQKRKRKNKINQENFPKV